MFKNKVCIYTFPVWRNAFLGYFRNVFICSTMGYNHRGLYLIVVSFQRGGRQNDKWLCTEIFKHGIKINYLSVQRTERWVIHFPTGTNIHQECSPQKNSGHKSSTLPGQQERFLHVSNIYSPTWDSVTYKSHSDPNQPILRMFFVSLGHREMGERNEKEYRGRKV